MATEAKSLSSNTNYEEHKKVKQQPWYRERLKLKYLKKIKKGEAPQKSLNTRNWVLLRPKMDDFRDGYPPDFDGVYFLSGGKGLSPALLYKPKDSLKQRMKDRNIKNNKQHPFLSKEQVTTDLKLPMVKMQQDHIEDVENQLKKHPLALYPHLEEGMPPELFDELVEILDPDINPIDEDYSEDEETETEKSDSTSIKDEIPVGTEGTTEKYSGYLISQSDETTTFYSNMESNGDFSGGNHSSSNPFKWMVEFEQDEVTGKLKKKKLPTTPPRQEEHIKMVTKQFCDWVEKLGGDENNIEESTMMSLFASGYETKPALSVPIHVVELSYIPMELRESAGISNFKSRQSSATTRNDNNKPATESDSPKGKQRVNYGKWYLKVNQWKPLKPEQKLEDPAAVRRREKSEGWKRSGEMDQQLAGIHGSRAFRNFLEKKGKRMPEFMNKVAQIQDTDEKNKSMKK